MMKWTIFCRHCSLFWAKGYVSALGILIVWYVAEIQCGCNDDILEKRQSQCVDHWEVTEMQCLNFGSSEEFGSQKVAKVWCGDNWVTPASTICLWLCMCNNSPWLYQETEWIASWSIRPQESKVKNSRKSKRKCCSFQNPCSNDFHKAYPLVN